MHLESGLKERELGDRTTENYSDNAINEMIEPLNASGASAIILATSWLTSEPLGSFVTSIAVIAIATMGLLLLFGRIDIRRAARLLVGCFVVFGASAIARGIFDAVSVSPGGADVTQASLQPVSPRPPASINPKPNTTSATPGSNPFDPYNWGSPQPR